MTLEQAVREMSIQLEGGDKMSREAEEVIKDAKDNDLVAWARVKKNFAEWYDTAMERKCLKAIKEGRSRPLQEFINGIA